MRTLTTGAERLAKACEDFSLLDEQDKMYILGNSEGLLQARQKPPRAPKQGVNGRRKPAKGQSKTLPV
jgi:hypothetical protein